jgi:glucose/arabinose dehydrogenase
MRAVTTRLPGLVSMGLFSLSLAGCPTTPPAEDTGTGTDAGMTDAPPDAGEPACGTGYPALDVELFANGLRSPVYMTQAPGSDDFFVVEQGGIIRVLDPSGTVLPTPFLDISSIVEYSGSIGDEQGLLGLAFHPDYETNGLFYVYYSQSGPGTGVGEDQVVARGTRATARTAEPTVQVILEIADQAGNHNGGCLQFGPDGELYIASGDGGPQGDPENDAENTSSILGKILRIHVDATTGDAYTIPATNPFAGATAGADEVFAYGLRNPWRFSFDRATGDLYIGDVGQGDWEEVDVVESGMGAGTDFGWNSCEGFEGYNAFGGATGTACTYDHHRPVVATSHNMDPVVPGGSCSVISGYVYRGAAIPALRGAYLFGDYCAGFVAGFRYCDGTVSEYQELPDLSGLCNGLVSFAEDRAGELYMVCINNGSIRRIIPG